MAMLWGLGVTVAPLTLAAQAAQAAPDAPAVPTAQGVRRGALVHARCLACHALAYDRVGPRHCGLLGRRAGSVPGFAYSQVMKRSVLIWDAQSLDRFLAAPMKFMPGTTMTYDGIGDRHARADLIAYLRGVDQTSACKARPRVDVAR